MKERVVVAMSGGVDSSVAAAMLVEQGYDVVGISMQLYDHGNKSEDRFDSCCSLSDMHDARVVAHKLGFPHYVVNYEKEFREGVIDYFADEYVKGRTPNPCVMCNSKLKFDHLLERAQHLGADWVATGHYARLVRNDEKDVVELYKAKDLGKDQSYFLFSVKQDFLKKAMFPLADLTKEEVRELAKKYDLHTSEKKESQEICFVTDKRYTEFLEKEYANKLNGSGDIIDLQGNSLGKHEGIHKYTVGQRKGLGIRTDTPKYVYHVDAVKNQIVVADLADLATDCFEIFDVNWLVDFDEVKSHEIVELVTRYHAKPIPARLEFDGNRCFAYLAEKAKWVSPGQAAVVYYGDRVLGGGFIARKN